MDDKIMGDRKENEFARYEAYQTSEEECVIYDTDNHTAWVKSENSVSVEELR